MSDPMPALPRAYTLCFAFSAAGDRVLLLRKQSPEWQRGKLNGVGGKVEDGETPVAAMVREFAEETGVVTDPADWQAYAALHGDSFAVTVYCLFDDAVLAAARTVEVHEVVICSTDWNDIKATALTNLRWLIAAALDARAAWAEGERLVMLRADYGR